jgi:hypothetical protein
MGLTKNPGVVVNILIGMGIFPLHVNVDLLKMKSLVEFTNEQIAAVEQLRENPPVDPDLVRCCTLHEVHIGLWRTLFLQGQSGKVVDLFPELIC